MSDEQRRSLSATEVLNRYADGQRDFRYVVAEGEDFNGANLRGASFLGASLSGACFREAVLTHAQFKSADLTSADLSHATLNGTDLIGGDFSDARLDGADLTGASANRSIFAQSSMRAVNFGNAVLDETELEGADLTKAKVGAAHLLDLDVGPFCDASGLTFRAPAHIDPRAVMKSYTHPRLKPFMISCGVPDVFAEFMIDCARSIGGTGLASMLRSTFISYGGPDEEFAQRIYDSLRAHGSVVYFFPATATFGERLEREIRAKLRSHDRVILLCSESSLRRPGVIHEIRETLDREAEDGGATYLLPITLDDFVHTGWRDEEPELAEQVTRRVVGDFRGAETDDEKFRVALTRLLAVLKK